MVATPNSIFTNFYFWFVVSLRFRLRQMATPLGMLKGQAIYLDMQNGCGFSSYFFFLIFFGYVFFYLFLFRIIVCVYSSLFLYLE